MKIYFTIFALQLVGQAIFIKATKHAIFWFIPGDGFFIAGSGFPKADSDTPTKHPSFLQVKIKTVHPRIPVIAGTVPSPTTCAQRKPFYRFLGNPLLGTVV